MDITTRKSGGMIGLALPSASRAVGQSGNRADTGSRRIGYPMASVEKHAARKAGKRKSGTSRKSFDVLAEHVPGESVS